MHIVANLGLGLVEPPGGRLKILIVVGFSIKACSMQLPLPVCFLQPEQTNKYTINKHTNKNKTTIPNLRLEISQNQSKKFTKIQG